MTDVPYNRVVLTDKAKRKARRRNNSLLPVWVVQKRVFELDGDLFKYVGEGDGLRQRGQYVLRTEGADIVFVVERDAHGHKAVVITQFHTKEDLEFRAGYAEAAGVAV